MPSPADSKELDSVLKEERIFPPPKEFAREARVKGMNAYKKLYNVSVKDPAKFWGGEAESLRWERKWEKVLEWNPPFAKWFVGGRINASANCLDRHVESWRRNKVALRWEGEPGDQRVLSYEDLWDETRRFANVLKKLGVARGDTVGIYMPMNAA